VGDVTPDMGRCECENADRGLYRYRRDPDWWSCEQCDGRVRPLTDAEKAARAR
jgi:hypothetical protein